MPASTSIAASVRNPVAAVSRPAGMRSSRYPQEQALGPKDSLSQPDWIRGRCRTFGAAQGRPHLRGNTHYRSEEHMSELQSLMRISYAVFCLKKKKNKT